MKNDKPMSVRALPMVKRDGKWWRARVVGQRRDAIRLEWCGHEEEWDDEWVGRTSGRLWRGSYRGKDWRYLADGAWAPKPGVANRAPPQRGESEGGGGRSYSSDGGDRDNDDDNDNDGDGDGGDVLDEGKRGTEEATSSDGEEESSSPSESAGGGGRIGAEASKRGRADRRRPRPSGAGGAGAAGSGCATEAPPPPAGTVPSPLRRPRPGRARPTSAADPPAQYRSATDGANGALSVLAGICDRDEAGGEDIGWAGCREGRELAVACAVANMASATRANGAVSVGAISPPLGGVALRTTALFL